jgi:hypothetical protein
MMNERIRELSEQCEGMTICECGSTGFNYEKFAELIVRECADIVADAVDHREPASTYVSKIKEHFGVES